MMCVIHNHGVRIYKWDQPNYMTDTKALANWDAHASLASSRMIGMDGLHRNYSKYSTSMC